MNRQFRPLVLAVAAALTLVLLTVVYEAAHVLFGECDSKFGCTGGIWFALLVSGIAASISGCTLILVVTMQVRTLARAPLRAVGLIGAAVGLVLAMLLRTVGGWPFELPVLLALWVSVTAAIGVALVAVVGRVVRSKLRV